MNKSATFLKVFKTTDLPLLEKTNPKTIGDKIRLIRLESRLSYNDFCRKTHIGTMTLYRWESNLRTPSEEHLNNFISIFNLDKNYFKIILINKRSNS